MQQSLREDPPELREPPPGAVHASRPNPITWPLVLRVLAIASAISLFFSLLGLFNHDPRTLVQRTAAYLAYGWIGAMLGLLSARLVWRLGLWPRGYWVGGLATGLIMTPPMSAVVYAGAVIMNGRPPPLSAVPDLMWETVLICIGMSLLAVLLSRRPAPQTAGGAPAPPKFLERLPLKLRGAEVWAVEAEDHYLRLHTSKGQDLILMRLTDAVAELAGIEGAQVHRSWWVARDAIADAKRGDGRATLTLKDGAEVPVSRTYARILRERNWI
ncbi:MAG: response regulator of the LytR/AlgR family [Phenylobacterium sp.]|nr:response regulator of the LytR/AlgR family [Phenylobacterium sp.]